ncbi:MAG: hypothetical protein ACKOFG_04960 [Limnohabitans sp.]
MNHVYRNPALQVLQARAPGAAMGGLRTVAFDAGMTWSCLAGEPPGLWFLETGLMALEQPGDAGPVALALLGADSAIPLLAPGMLQLRALSDGHALCLSAEQALSHVPDLLLGWQQGLLERMARQAACARAHGPAQALADALLWAHRAGAGAVAWTVKALPAGQRLAPEAREQLLVQWVAAGALRRQGAALQVQDESVLAALACCCLRTPA